MTETARALWRKRGTALLAAVLGAAAFLLAGLPLPLLLGPMAGCLVFALSGARMAGMGVAGVFMRTFLGVAIGASITPEVLGQVPGMAASLAVIPVLVVATGLPGYVFFRRVAGFDPPTAFYSAMPGGLQDMLVFGEEAGGDPRALSLVHATRVLVIVTAAPFVLTLAYDLDLTRPPGEPASAIPLWEIAVMTAAGVAGWKIGERVGLFGASILGPLILTALLSLAGVIEHRPPAEIIWAAQFFIGIAVGAKYAGITARELRRDVTAGLGYAVILALVSLTIVEIVLQFSPAEPLEVLLAFLPGGQAEMVIIAILAGADLAFVVTHHLLRIMVVILLAPIVFGRFRR